MTRKLLDHYGISTPLTPYHEHNAAAARPKLLARLAAGESIALVSDAGTPLISDPGFKLVRAACEAGLRSARRPALRRACGARGRRVADRPVLLRGFPAAEGRPAPDAHRGAGKYPRDAHPVRKRPAHRPRRWPRWPRNSAPAQAAVCRELTKLHEEVRRGDLSALARTYQADAEIRGEFTIVIAPPAADAGRPDAGEVDALLRRALQHASVKDAVSDVAAATGRPRREIYQRALALSEGR